MWSWRLRRILRPGIWQLVTQENQYCNWVQVQRSENQKKFFLWYFIYSRWTGSSHPHWTNDFEITMTQILISPGNTIQTYLDILFNLGTPWPVKLTHKINYHNGALMHLYWNGLKSTFMILTILLTEPKSFHNFP